MSVKVIDSTPIVKLTVRTQGSLALRFMLDDIDRIANPVTPKRFGNLRRDLLKQVIGLSSKIIWGKNYAIFQENKQYQNYTTPGTGPHFAQNSVYKVTANADRYFNKAGMYK